jgi:hypothetical protein
MERSVTAHKGNRWLDLRRAFRPVPGLGVSHLQFPMAHAMGYSLSPSGLGTVKKSHRLARPPVVRMEQGVTSYWSNHWLDLRRAFRPVSGLGVSHLQFHANNHSLKAVPHGYSLSPSGLGTVKKSHRLAACK